MKHLLRLLAFLTLLCWLVPMMPARADGSLVGALLSDAQNTDLFGHFHLVQVSQQGNTISFKPSGPDFRDLVTLRVRVNGDKHITAMELGLARSFIDSKPNGVFARDIASTFLRTALASNDRQTNAALIGWISNLAGYRVLQAAPQQAPTDPQPPTYEVYLGTRPQAEQALSSGKLSLRNVKESDVDWLWMKVSGR